ncbi:MAG: histidinol dehydrogenase [Bacillota bacterium]|nr:histidinol dehydrogenase [Bacillota bacterium]
MENNLLRTVTANGENEYRLIADMHRRSEEENRVIAASAQAIISDVKNRGFTAVSEYSMRFDKAEPYEVSAETVKNAYDGLMPELREALQDAAKNIRDYHERMLCKTWGFEREKGAYTGQIVAPLGKAGIYVPGGTAAYPSSVLMIAIPAKVAGVKEIVMVTPPGKNLNGTVLAAAYIAGVDRVFAVGGVQAVAALSFGAGLIPKVDKIAGPGNAYVAAAKRLVFGTVDIDMVAGPSEVLVIADESANPAYIAADLMSQAEHDVLASAVLITTSDKIAASVNEEILRQIKALSRAEIIKKSLASFGAAVVCKTLKQAAEIANEIAPEHLEIVTKDPRALLPDIKNAGAVFLGEYSPEPLGDYMAGPSHVLPTSGTARFFSPLSTDSFLKKTSVIEYNRETLIKLSDKIMLLAENEGLGAHANAISVRKKG